MVTMSNTAGIMHNPRSRSRSECCEWRAGLKTGPTGGKGSGSLIALGLLVSAYQFGFLARGVTPGWEIFSRISIADARAIPARHAALFEARNETRR